MKNNIVERSMVIINAVLLVFFLGYSICKLNIDTLIQVYIFLALLWYSWETANLRRQTQVQNENSIKPILNLHLRSDDSKKEFFEMENIGAGVAYNISIKEIRTKDYVYKFYFDESSKYLSSQKKVQLKFGTETKDGLIAHDIVDFKNHLKRSDLKRPPEKKYFIFNIVYLDLNGQKYNSLFIFYNALPLADNCTMELLGFNKGVFDEKEIKEAIKKFEFRKGAFV